MNRLATETSPYLRQHAENPVEWYPWGPEALDRARAEDKPLFISIGYASCHWCHVMAHESFEDPEVAADLARSFISVKVDREERPDLDAVYMAATQALTGAGGWPMSVFCTPDGRPFFAGTYFPPADRHGMPSFRRVVTSLADAYSTRRSEVEEQADVLADAIRKGVALPEQPDRATAAEVEPGAASLRWGSFAEVLGDLVVDLEQRFDPEWGGFGPAPKFPRPSFIELCLRHHRRTGDPGALQMATRTLDAMAAGGLYDHLVGGFARYSTDRQWLVPHFEKMLTDQALLARAYLHAWQVTGNPDYLQVTTETLDYVIGALGAPGGGLFSSEDADAGGVEGSHATFTPDQVRQALDDAGRGDLAAAALEWYGVTVEGNWEGTSVLRRPLGAPLARPADVEIARRILAEARATRPQPALDDKVLTEWNAMAAATLAEAAAATGNERWGAASAAIVDFLFAELRQPNGRWLRSWQGGTARHLALAADLAWLVESCTRLAELTGQARWVARAGEVADALLEGFWDGGPEGAGGFFTTGNDAEPLIARPKELADGAVPSANSIAAWALLRLSAMTGLDRYRAPAEQIVDLAVPWLAEHPIAVADLVAATELVDEAMEIVIPGHAPALVAEVHERWLPAAVLAWGEPFDSPLWEGRTEGSASVCRGFVCQSPTTDPATLAAELDAPPPDVHLAGAEWIDLGDLGDLGDPNDDGDWQPA